MASVPGRCLLCLLGPPARGTPPPLSGTEKRNVQRTAPQCGPNCVHRHSPQSAVARAPVSLSQSVHRVDLVGPVRPNLPRSHARRSAEPAPATRVFAKKKHWRTPKRGVSARLAGLYPTNFQPPSSVFLPASRRHVQPSVSCQCHGTDTSS